ncbi:MAG: hypothetical protein AAF518_13460 [Spirochaetota bacterium]
MRNLAKSIKIAFIAAILYSPIQLLAKESSQDLVEKIQILNKDFQAGSIKQCKKNIKYRRCSKQLQKALESSRDEFIGKIQASDKTFTMSAIPTCQGKTISKECLNTLVQKYNSGYDSLLLQAKVLKVEVAEGCSTASMECTAQLNEKVHAAIMKIAIKPWARRSRKSPDKDISYATHIANSQEKINACKSATEETAFRTCIGELREGWFSRWKKIATYSIFPQLLRKNTYCMQEELSNTPRSKFCGGNAETKQVSETTGTASETAPPPPPSDSETDKAAPVTPANATTEIPNKLANQIELSMSAVNRTKYITYFHIPVVLAAGYFYYQYNNYLNQSSQQVDSLISDYTLFSSANASGNTVPTSFFRTYLLINTANQSAYENSANQALGRVQIAGAAALLIHLFNVTDVLWNDWNAYDSIFEYGKPVAKAVSETEASLFLDNRVVTIPTASSVLSENQYAIGIHYHF